MLFFSHDVVYKVDMELHGVIFIMKFSIGNQESCPFASDLIVKYTKKDILMLKYSNEDVTYHID